MGFCGCIITLACVCVEGRVGREGRMPFVKRMPNIQAILGSRFLYTTLDGKPIWCPPPISFLFMTLIGSDSVKEARTICCANHYFFQCSCKPTLWGGSSVVFFFVCVLFAKAQIDLSRHLFAKSKPTFWQSFWAHTKGTKRQMRCHITVLNMSICRESLLPNCPQIK